MVTAMSMGEVFDEMLGSIKYAPDSKTGQMYPFYVRVGCVKRRPPRHEYFEYIRDMGRGAVERICDHKPFVEEGSLGFIFPERWMGVAEQQAFMHSLVKHQDVSRIKSMDMITSSPLIIGDFMREHIVILSWEDDDNYRGAT
jgi:hypothetical protein